LSLRHVRAVQHQATDEAKSVCRLRSAGTRRNDRYGIVIGRTRSLTGIDRRDGENARTDRSFSREATGDELKFMR
jgi:hypothetical protein